MAENPCECNKGHHFAVIALIPLTYWEALRKPFQELAGLASKASGVCASYRKLQHHKACGTWPPHIESVKALNIPVTKDFGRTEASGTLFKAMTDSHAAYRISLLDHASGKS